MQVKKAQFLPAIGLIAAVLVLCISATGFAAETFYDHQPALEKIQKISGFDTLPQAQDDLYQLVRDRLRFEIYPGLLRGVKGTAMARAGNSLDQSLLLHFLLTSQGHRARIVQGTLGEPYLSLALDRFWGDIQRRRA